MTDTVRDLMRANHRLRQRIAQAAAGAEAASEGITKMATMLAEARAEITRLRAEAANLRTVMVAAAEEIAAHWDAHCDAEGYGPVNLQRRLEAGIPSEYGYTAGAFAELRAERDHLRAALSQQAGWQPIETAPYGPHGYRLIANVGKGHVAVWIDGVIHNRPGTAHDWQYGEAITHWMPLPAAPQPGAQEGR